MNWKSEYHDSLTMIEINWENRIKDSINHTKVLKQKFNKLEKSWGRCVPEKWMKCK